LHLEALVEPGPALVRPALPPLSPISSSLPALASHQLLIAGCVLRSARPPLVSQDPLRAEVRHTAFSGCLKPCRGQVRLPVSTPRSSPNVCHSRPVNVCWQTTRPNWCVRATHHPRRPNRQACSWRSPPSPRRAAPAIITAIRPKSGTIRIKGPRRMRPGCASAARRSPGPGCPHRGSTGGHPAHRVHRLPPS
jgi:hypothetical protein